VHFLEEVFTDFHKKFPPFKMPLWVFVTFDLLFQGFFWLVWWNEAMIYRETWMHVFALLMFANGIWHIVWWAIEKKYVPGLITAPLHLIAFIYFYFSL